MTDHASTYASDSYLDLLVKQATSGDGDAQIKVGRCYFEGKGVLKDNTLALNYFKLATAQGHVEGPYYLSSVMLEDMHFDNLPIFSKYLHSTKLAKILKLLYLGSQCGDKKASTLLNKCHDVITKLTIEGRTIALMLLADVYNGSEQYPKIVYHHRLLELIERLKDPQVILKRFEKLAKKQDVDALFMLASLYLSGIVVEQDYDKAIIYLKLAIKQNDAQALFYLGICYRYGLGLPKNKQNAFKYFKLAANRGVADAQFQTGLCYEQGNGVGKSIDLALEYYHKAANLGESRAQERLATLQSPNDDSKSSVDQVNNTEREDDEIEIDSAASSTEDAIDSTAEGVNES